MMKVTYDTEVDAKYVSIKKGKVFDTKIINDWLFFDINKDGEVIGIEILGYSKNDVRITVDQGNLSQVFFDSKTHSGVEDQFKSVNRNKIVAESAVIAV